jgi:hypothetical protein
VLWRDQRHETKQIRDSLGCSGSGAGASQTLGRRSLERAAELRRRFASGSSIATDVSGVRLDYRRVLPGNWQSVVADARWKLSVDWVLRSEYVLEGVAMVTTDVHRVMRLPTTNAWRAHLHE